MFGRPTRKDPRLLELIAAARAALLLLDTLNRGEGQIATRLRNALEALKELT